MRRRRRPAPRALPRERRDRLRHPLAFFREPPELGANLLEPRGGREEGRRSARRVAACFFLVGVRRARRLALGFFAQAVDERARGVARDAPDYGPADGIAA